jgi:tetratricopeptide (TPR) repeat protein
MDELPRSLRWPVRRTVSALLALLLWALVGPHVQADEPIVRFIEGLRERGYFDTAIEYLEVIRQRTDLSPEVAEVLDLQLGLTWQQRAASSRVPEDREKAVGEAERALRKFLAEKGQHSQAALANSMLGELLFERAKSLIWKAEGLDTPPERLELQQSARTLIDQAKTIYQTSADQYKAAYDAFPKFIDETKDEDQYQLRQEAESRYLRAWFNLVRCTYERGQTFDKGSAERKNTLIEASTKFEEIHTARRTNQIGLHARLMMGKCFQEQDDVGRALGIYNEMLSHPSQSPAVESLKGIAQHYRCICLNDPQKNDHQLVVQEATAWLTSHRQQSTTATGLGILWEKAIAEEKLAAARELDPKQKETLLNAALNDSRQVARYPGPYKEPAAAMERRLKLELGEKDREPRDFASAFERARGMISQIQQLSDEVNKAADANDKAQKQAALDNHLTEVGRLLQLALDLKDSDSDAKAVAQARYLLSFVMLRQGKALDSIILATYCLVNDRKADPDTALNATEIAMAAAVAAWNEAPAKDRDFETRTLRDVCMKILELFPQSSRGSEARMRLGSAYRTMGQPLEAAKWYLEVPEADPQFATARISAGQSYWAAWTQKAAMEAADPEGQKTPPEDMLKWKAEARNLLTQGIDLTRQKIGEMAKPSEELVAAEVSLASILNLDGEFPATIDRLTKGNEFSVVAAIEIPEGQQRPEDGIQSKSFASLTYRLLLRAYVGTQQIDAALQVMSRLERVGGSDILAAYTQLGIELQDELKRLKASGEAERLAQVRDSFEKFLQKVYESRNKSDYNSLLWIGETYYGLGQGVSGDSTSATAYFSKAGDAYSEIISGSLASAENKNAVLLRLARCRRQQQQFEEAMKILQEILVQNPMTIDAQFEAAQTLSDWAATNDPSKFTLAVQGIKEGSSQTVWGWTTLARRLEQIIAKDPSSELRARFVEARYELSNSRRRYARVSQADADKQRQNALAEITSFVQRYSDLDDVAFAKFDRLYQDLQADLGQSAKPLERYVAVPVVPAERAPEAAAQASALPTEPDDSAPVAEAEAPSGGGWVLPVLVVGLCVGLGAVVFVLMRRPQKHARIPGSNQAPKFSAVDVEMEAVAGDDLNLLKGFNVDAPKVGDLTALAGAVSTPKRSQGATTRPQRPAAAESAGRAASAAVAPAARPRPAAPGDGSAPIAKPRPAAAPQPSAGAAKPATAARPQSSAAPAAGAKPAAVRPAPKAPPSPDATAASSAPPRSAPNASAPKSPEAKPAAAPRPVATRPASAGQPPAGAAPTSQSQPAARPATSKPAPGAAPTRPPASAAGSGAAPATKPPVKPPAAPKPPGTEGTAKPSADARVVRPKPAPKPPTENSG